MQTLPAPLGEAIDVEANKLGVTTKVVREKFEHADESVRPAQLIADALRGMAVSDSVTEELRATQRELTVERLSPMARGSKDEEIAELERELKALRSARSRSEAGEPRLKPPTAPRRRPQPNLRTPAPRWRSTGW